MCVPGGSLLVDLREFISVVCFLSVQISGLQTVKVYYPGLLIDCVLDVVCDTLSKTLYGLVQGL